MTALAQRPALPVREAVDAAARIKTVAIFSFHLYDQPRRGGMHWVAESFRTLGWDVRFVTCDYSALTLMKGDRRTRYGKPQGRNRLKRLAPDLSVAILVTPWHAIGRKTGTLHRLAGLLTQSYPWPFAGKAASFARGADLVIMESCGALMFSKALRAATTAPIVYRVSDNLDVIRPVPALLAAEKRTAALADAVSLASPLLARKFADGAALRLDPMGLDRTLYDAGMTSPYPANGRKRVIISGSSSFDHDSVERACHLFPNWDFYQIGSLDRPVSRPNAILLGERSYRDVVAYVLHADIGFAPYLVRPGFEYQAEHSNRLLQYVYCRLPSVVPEALSAGRPHYLGYRAGDSHSIRAAFTAAADFDRNAVPRESVIDWTELARRLAGIERQVPV